jgi:hypothetical protein
MFFVAADMGRKLVALRVWNNQIRLVLGTPRYALAAPVFPFRALAALAGRATLGGARETALATLIAARLAAGVGAPLARGAQLRAARADAARLWMSSVALPAPVRSAIARLVDATAGDDPKAVGTALGKVMDVTAPYLDKPARFEMDRLAVILRG